MVSRAVTSMFSYILYIYISLYISFIFIPTRLHFTSLCSPSADYPLPTGGNVVSPRVHCQQHGWMLLLLMSAYPDALKFMMDSDVLFAFTAGIRICCKKKIATASIELMGKVITVCLPCLFAPGQRAASFVHAGDKVVCTSNQTSLSILQYFCPLPLPPPLSLDCSILSESSMCMCMCDYFLSLSSVLSLTLHCFSFFVSCYHSSHWKKILIF